MVVMFLFTSQRTLAVDKFHWSPTDEIRSSSGRNITVDDPDFTASFASSFLSFVISEDPNLKVNARSVTPSWPNFGGVQSEMLFNRTQDGLPDIKLVESDGERLERCRQVKRSIVPLPATAHRHLSPHRLWQSLIAFTGQ